MKYQTNAAPSSRNTKIFFTLYHNIQMKVVIFLVNHLISLSKGFVWFVIVLKVMVMFSLINERAS